MLSPNYYQKGKEKQKQTRMLSNERAREMLRIEKKVRSLQVSDGLTEVTLTKANKGRPQYARTN
jgi:hypothetical protein